MDVLAQIAQAADGFISLLIMIWLVSVEMKRSAAVQEKHDQFVEKTFQEKQEAYKELMELANKRRAA